MKYEDCMWIMALGIALVISVFRDPKPLGFVGFVFIVRGTIWAIDRWIESDKVRGRR